MDGCNKTSNLLVFVHFARTRHVCWHTDKPKHHDCRFLNFVINASSDKLNLAPLKLFFNIISSPEIVFIIP